MDRDVHQRARRDHAACGNCSRTRCRNAGMPRHRRRPSRSPGQDHRPRRRRPRPLRTPSTGHQGDVRETLLDGPNRLGRSDQGHHQHAGLHSSGRRRRGADAGKKGRPRSRASLPRHHRLVGQLFRPRDRGPARIERLLRHWLHDGPGAKGSWLCAENGERRRRSARSRRPRRSHFRAGQGDLWRWCLVNDDRQTDRGCSRHGPAGTRFPATLEA